MRTRRRLYLSAMAVSLLLPLHSGFAQAPGGGAASGAIARLGILEGQAPGWFYYGINAADRGLGYYGSYMTLGGFIPYAEDDLGGFWAADLRSHLSVNGGFFSNVGAVRKQFIGGTLLGVGVYWDYDGDLNQYPIWGQAGTSEFGQFGHAYNQVGVSGEWLTDYGNLRTNGYIPVGQTAHTLGAPGSPFTGNFLLCQTGLDSALGGADLEIGAYVPGLADWAGMVSVGGYALGNAAYEWQEGNQIGQPVVPWFGGVYTRLDLTFLENWDFSLQANNDSYFNWTGFARLTYRMGGSRRRNVPDQVEQPMMRNEHIVRAHQTPIVALNPATDQPWNVIHVDNSAALGGDGTAEAPLPLLQLAQTRATNPFDIVYVHSGNSGTDAAQRYESNWQFQADDQILVGQGSAIELNTINCGPRQFFNQQPGSRPVLTSAGTAITLRDGAIVDHFRIEDAPIGIAAEALMTREANVNDVQIAGADTAGDRGVVLTNLAAGTKVNLFNMALTNMDFGLIVDGGAADVDFQGMMMTTEATGASVLVQGTTGGTINVNRTANTLQTPLAANEIFNVSYAINDSASQADAALAIENTSGTTVRLGQLAIGAARNRAFQAINNAATTTISIAGTSELASASNTLPTFESSGDARLEIDLDTLSSALPNATGQAVTLSGTSTGFLTVSDSFLVGGAPGTVPVNVTNTTPVVVTVP